jgi:methylmalonyl-CoA mutase cobalamin-binding subunit
MKMIKKKILGAAIGNCVHISGLYHFLKLAEKEGYSTILLGPAIPPKQIVENIKIHNPDIVAISYRLTPNVGVSLVMELMDLLNKSKITNVKFIFGGTPPAAEALGKLNFFDKIFSGKESIREITGYLRGSTREENVSEFPDTLLDRISAKYPYPLLRHHFGRPDLQETIEGVKKIAESEVLDIISLGTDQNAQEHFFHSEDMLKELEGAGGVPVRNSVDLKEIYKASRYGNFPLVRCYSGTRDLLSWAKMSVETIHNAWAAIPLCWYSVIDGRSKRSLYDAISENQSVMKWYAEMNIPVEVNESHQWSLRDAHDSLAVTMAFLAAYNAKKAGVKNYIAQYMFNTPPGTSPKMDVAKMLAKLKMIESLEDENFKAFREVRAGIAHFSSVPSEAKGQLAASAVISLVMQPHILHVVGFSEGDHACYPEELIESCNIIHGVLQNCLYDLPEFSSDNQVINRRDELIDEAKVLLDSIRILGEGSSEDPWSDPRVLSASIKNGILDAPHFRGNPNLCGKIITRLINGAWYAVDESGSILKESQRTRTILDEIKELKS